MIRCLIFFMCSHLSAFLFPAAAQSFRSGRTAGPLPYLEYGLGDDRLGGAKMTYLDSLIAVKVVDSVGDDYKVQLSALHAAWLPKSSFKPDSTLIFRPYYLSESWKVFGTDTADYLSVSLDERLPYRSLQQINPSRVVVDLFGVTSNTNWITQLSTAKEIKNAYYEQIEDDVLRVIIELKHPQHWGYRIYYAGNRLFVRINRQPAVLSLSKLKIAVDAGHGGDNSGASGIKSKILEKEYTLKIARELEKSLLKEKAKVYMTRRKDTSLTMVERITALQEESPQLLISIHLNSSGRDTISGTSTYYRYIGFRPLTQAILRRMRELGLKEYGNVGSFNFSLSGPTDYPNCLVEVAFLSNPADEKKLLNPAFHKQVAAKIVAGIKDWLKALPK